MKKREKIPEKREKIPEKRQKLPEKREKKWKNNTKIGSFSSQDKRS
jgi:hypothetical protein